VNGLLQAARDAGSRAAKIVSNMLEFSRKSESNIAYTDLNQLLDKAVALCRNDYDMENKYDFMRIIIEKEYDPTLGPVPCTATRIEQVLLNLIGNAAHAMAEAREGSPPPKVILRTRSDGEYAVIEIQDNGPGMTDEVKRRVFEPFYSTKQVGHGTGLGLSVSYFIITENHKGTITVESEPGKGAKFTIRLPKTR
jgi:signal transduction histidine kinase